MNKRKVKWKSAYENKLTKKKISMAMKKSLFLNAKK